MGDIVVNCVDVTVGLRVGLNDIMGDVVGVVEFATILLSGVVGYVVGAVVGFNVVGNGVTISMLGLIDGDSEGAPLLALLGLSDGLPLGLPDGYREGAWVIGCDVIGLLEGLVVLSRVGDRVGSNTTSTQVSVLSSHRQSSLHHVSPFPIGHSLQVDAVWPPQDTAVSMLLLPLSELTTSFFSSTGRSTCA